MVTYTRGTLAYGTEELLGLLFSHGYLGVRHAHVLLEEARSPERTSRLLHGLLHRDLVERVPHVSPYSPANRKAHGEVWAYRPSGAPAPGSTPGGKWELIYSLSTAGIGYVGEQKGLKFREAERLYNRVRSEARMNHALLRTEFFSMLSGEVRGRTGPLPDPQSLIEGLMIEVLGAESTAGPLVLPKHAKGSRRSLEPDGVIVLSDMRYREPLVAYVESDTGSQDKFEQVASKANAYASYLSSTAAADNLYGDSWVPPCVIFLSPSAKRSMTVRRFLKRAALDTSSNFARARATMQEKDKVDIAGLFAVTNLEWLNSHGALGASYWTLDSKALRGLQEL